MSQSPMEPAPADPAAVDLDAIQDPLELPFDQYQRYRLVADLVSRLLADDPRGAVLDVGGRTALLRRFLPGRPVWLVDFEASDAKKLVVGDGSRLPFRDKSFDAVTACDTLEHVPPDRRADFVRECCRVSRKAVVLAGPYRAPRVDEGEDLLLDLVRGKLGFEHRYLEEHRLLGLPVQAETEAAMAEAGAQVRTVGHANLERWLALMSLELYMDEEPQLRKVARRYFRFYNQALYQADFAPPHYRHAVIGWMGARPLGEALGDFGAGSATGTERPFAELLAELVAFDRERDVFQAERTRLMAVNDGLVKDLEEHREALGTVQADLDEHRRVVEGLTAEVGEVRAHAAGLETALDEVHRRLGAMNDELRAAYEAGEALRAELRSRKKNLRRALSWKKPAF